MAVGAGPAHALYFACYEKIKFTLSDAVHPGANSHFANGKLVALRYEDDLLRVRERSTCGMSGSDFLFFWLSSRGE